MAKSLRSKSKLASRRKKANESHYAVVEASRTARLSARLLKKGAGEGEGDDEEMEADAEAEGEDADMAEGASASAPRAVPLTPQPRRRSPPRRPATRAASSGAPARAWPRVPSSRARTSSAAPSRAPRPARPSAAARLPVHPWHPE